MIGYVGQCVKDEAECCQKGGIDGKVWVTDNKNEGHCCPDGSNAYVEDNGAGKHVGCCTKGKDCCMESTNEKHCDYDEEKE